MIDHTRYKKFSDDKLDFFSQCKSINDAQSRANQTKYGFLLKHQMLIENEFLQLLSNVKKEGKDRAEFWLYCFYLSELLCLYFKAREKKSESDKYADYSKRLKIAFDKGFLPDEEEKKIKQQIASDLRSLASTPFHIEKIRDWIGFTNLYRIHFLFCRLSLKQFILLAKALQWLEGLNQIFGFNLNADQMVAVINAPTPIFNFLSVGFFAARLLISLGLMIKHGFFPSEEEAKISIKERFYHEWKVRHCVILNDVVWASVNLLTNYSFILELSAPVAAWLTAGFLVFDISLLFYGRYLAEQDYRLKKAQYDNEESKLKADKAAAVDDLVRYRQIDKRLEMVQQQRQQLEIEHQTANATFLFRIGGAALLMGGFTAGLLMATPAAVVVCYFVCTVGVAMYLSANMYEKYKEKRLTLDQCISQNITGEAMDKAQNAMMDARNAYIITLLKNIIMPLLIVGTFTICWPAALTITVLYISYECTKAYVNKEDKKKDKTAAPLIEAAANAEVVDDGVVQQASPSLTA
jgi:hypothetical protein